MILCGCGHMFDWLGSQADVHSAVFILFRWLWHAAWMHWCWQWMWGEPDSWQHLHFSELMQDDLSHDTRPQPVIYTATAVMWVKWAEIREKWQEERKKKKRGSVDTILHKHILFEWRLYSSYISGLPFISMGWNSIDSPSLPAVWGNVSAQGRHWGPFGLVLCPIHYGC